MDNLGILKREMMSIINAAYDKDSNLQELATAKMTQIMNGVSQLTSLTTVIDALDTLDGTESHGYRLEFGAITGAATVAITRILALESQT